MSSNWLVSQLQRYGPNRPRHARPTTRQARAYCRRLARRHYENFLVATFALPRNIRRHFYSIYAYCRWADDLADETGDRALSLELLDWWERLLEDCYRGETAHPVFVAMEETVHALAIPIEPFRRLLQAFRQDQSVRRYRSFAELLLYCENSANPVGELVLHLAGCHTPQRVALSDQICTGLQLANFWQDIAGDYRRGRLYLPLDDMQRFGCQEADLALPHAGSAVRKLVKFQVDRAAQFLRDGAPLSQLVPRWLQVDIKMFVRGGDEILQAIRRLDYDVLSRRPAVSRLTQLKLLTSTWLQLSRSRWQESRRS